VFTRHRAEVKAVSGVYGASYQGDEDFSAVSREVAAFARAEGRQPRMLVVKLGQDGHDRGMKVIATCVRRPRLRRRRRAAVPDTGRGRAPGDRQRRARGRRVEPGGRPQDARARARERARRPGAPQIAVVVGGIIPPRDYAFLRESGVAAVFGPGTPVPKAAREVLRWYERGVDEQSGGIRRDVCAAIRAGDRRAIARTITLLESTRADRAERGQEILDALVLDTGGALRSASPVRPASARARSSRRSGLSLLDAGHRVAVLAVDPSSPVTRGSILGDKTRMERLAQRDEAFIRPSPSGGYARRCRTAHARVHARLRGGRLRRGDRRDGRDRPVRGRRSPAWSTSSSCCSSPARATSCRGSRRACSSSPTGSS
jgi:methylmalonyl-CoA mutase cobalamin-binding subunit